MEFTATSTTIVGSKLESLTDFQWLLPKISDSFGKSAQNAVVNDLVGAGGMISDMKKISVTFDDGSVASLVVKHIHDNSLPRSIEYGLTREAFFYDRFSATLKQHGVQLPKVVHVYGNSETGEKSIVFEDLSSSCVQSGYFFDTVSPHNWGKDLASILSQSRPAHLNEVPMVGMLTVARETFRHAARMHVAFWEDSSLQQHSFVKGNDWYRGEGEASWQVTQAAAKRNWTATLEKIAAGESGVKWDAHLLACMEASLAKISWSDFQDLIHNRTDRKWHWTLAHGDFHPANIMWRWPTEAELAADATAVGSPVLLDFEAVGLGSGAQDLAQYLISHMAPTARKEHESSLLHGYYDEFQRARAAAGVANDGEYSFEDCHRDYVEGGVGRWVWLLALLSSMCPDPLTQFFHDQVLAFMVDHNITPENIPMPRAQKYRKHTQGNIG